MKPLFTAHPIYDPFHWLERAADAWVRAGVVPDDYLRPPAVRRLGKLASRIGLDRNFFYGSRAYLGVMAHASAARCVPRVYLNEIVPFIMDCWEPLWDVWESILRRYRCRVACFTARQSAQEMQRRIPGLTGVWAPEGIDLSMGYRKGPPLKERSIDVLQIGRVYTPLHEQIVGPLEVSGRKYVYPTGEGWLFPDNAALFNAYADTKVFFCYPRCDTHPERSGSVETMTLRYLEGFASGTIVAGRAPQELVDLFGYDPVVPVDINDNPAGVVMDLLDRAEDYQPLVDRNYRRLAESGTWDHRARDLLAELRTHGYGTRAHPPTREG